MPKLIESVDRIEPALLDELPGSVADVIAELSAASATLGKALHPRTAAHLADLVRIMNTYYSNLIEGHDTRPRDIERALAGEFDPDDQRRDLQREAAAHVRVQAEIDRLAAEGSSPIRHQRISFENSIVSSIGTLLQACSRWQAPDVRS